MIVLTSIKNITVCNTNNKFQNFALVEKIERGEGKTTKKNSYKKRHNTGHFSWL